MRAGNVGDRDDVFPVHRARYSSLGETWKLPTFRLLCADFENVKGVLLKYRMRWCYFCLILFSGRSGKDCDGDSPAAAGKVILHFCVKAVPLTTCTGLNGTRRLRFPEILYSRHIKVVMLPPLHTGRLYPQEMSRNRSDRLCLDARLPSVVQRAPL